MSNPNYAFPKLKNVDPSCYIDSHNLILECSNTSSPRSFTMKFLELLKKVCPYDQAIVFFLDSNKKLSGKYSINADEKWLESYLNYYTHCTDFNFTLNPKDIKLCTFSKIFNWSEYPKSEFINDYIRPKNLHYSWGFAFFDLSGAYRVVVSLDRLKNQPFTENEKSTLGLSLPILNNIYKNFYYQGIDNDDEIIQSPWVKYNLTTRETEIANLLCQGMSVANISQVLFIAVTTTYKHIAHIYEKVGVSSQQELLVKALNKKLF